MSAATKTVEPAEAVIISGKRRGQIIRLANLDNLDSEMVDWDSVDESLDALNRKLVSVSQEVRKAVKVIKASGTKR